MNAIEWVDRCGLRAVFLQESTESAAGCTAARARVSSGTSQPDADLPSAFGQSNTWYANALADKMAGTDACGVGETEISASFNSSFTDWDYGVSGVPAAGKYNFLTVVLHELGHGLGFLGSMTSDGGIGSWGRSSGRPDIYDRFSFTATGAGAGLLSFPSPSLALGAELVSGRIYFGGDNAIAANSGRSPKLEKQSSTPQPRVQLFTP
ncbi:MAG: hypothetical protein Q7R41_20645 [Phycisphaerales bacterium]|nr:hypothetical protein [Phycisphaerales bacterium]